MLHTVHVLFKEYNPVITLFQYIRLAMFLLICEYIYTICGGLVAFNLCKRCCVCTLLTAKHIPAF